MDVILTWDVEEVGGVLSSVGELSLLPARPRRRHPVQGGDERFVVGPELKQPAIVTLTPRLPIQVQRFTCTCLLLYQLNTTVN